MVFPRFCHWPWSLYWLSSAFSKHNAAGCSRVPHIHFEWVFGYTGSEREKKATEHPWRGLCRALPERIGRYQYLIEKPMEPITTFVQEIFGGILTNEIQCLQCESVGFLISLVICLYSHLENRKGGSFLGFKPRYIPEHESYGKVMSVQISSRLFTSQS